MSFNFQDMYEQLLRDAERKKLDEEARELAERESKIEGATHLWQTRLDKLKPLLPKWTWGFLRFPVVAPDKYNIVKPDNYHCVLILTFPFPEGSYDIHIAFRQNHAGDYPWVISSYSAKEPYLNYRDQDGESEWFVDFRYGNQTFDTLEAAILDAGHLSRMTVDVARQAEANNEQAKRNAELLADANLDRDENPPTCTADERLFLDDMYTLLQSRMGDSFGTND